MSLPAIAAAAVLAAGLVLGCAPSAAADESVRAMTDEARKVADQLIQRVRGELTQEMERSGPLRSILVCKYSSPEIAGELSRKTGWRISRIALRPRNPASGAPDAWEQKVLVEFEQRAAAGETGGALEHAEIVKEPVGRYFRYMKALPMAQPCMACHGPASAIAEAVRTRLAAEYPYDTAVGYEPGQVRGAVTVKRPLAAR